MKGLELRWVSHGSGDQAALVELRREVLRRPLGLDYTSEQLADEADELHLGGWLGERLAGCLVLKDRGNGLVQMRQVAVAPELRGSGVGRELVAEAEAEARRRGFERMTLHARESAVAFYERLGYKIEGEPFYEIGLPHRLMYKAMLKDL